MACSKTSRTPSLVLAEHSRYLWAPIFRRTSSPYASRTFVSFFGSVMRDTMSLGREKGFEAGDEGDGEYGVGITCSGVTGFCDVLWSSSRVLWSLRRSFLQPTRMIGRPGQKWRTSEIH